MENNQMTKVSETLSYDPSAIIGRGSFGTIVFSGLQLASTPVAVKRIQKLTDDILNVQKEVELMMKAKGHPHILRYVGTEMNEYFLFIVTELCVGTLQEYIAGRRYTGPRFQGEREILFQITRGLAHLHELDIVHRDLKPVNILIYVPPSEGNEEPKPPIIKLADFGISKALDADKEDFTNTGGTNPKGTRGWIAPEVYKLKRFDFKVDIYALGLISYYTLSGGKHPFGDNPDVWAIQIKNKAPMKIAGNDLKKSYPKNAEAIKLIKSMLAVDPCERPTAEEVEADPFFFANRQKLFQSISAFFHNGNITANDIAQFEKLLTDDSIIVNFQFSKYGLTPLHILCRRYGNNNLINVVRLLIQKGAKVNTKEGLGNTPLNLLCKYYKEDNLKDIIQLFIEKGAEINTKNNEGWTPLHSLCRYYEKDNLIDIVQLLIRKGAEVNSKNQDGWTPLHILCRYYQNDNLIHIVQLLIEKGAEVNTKNKNGWTPLQFLCQNYQNGNLIDIVQLLIGTGAEVNTKNKNGWTPLHILCQNYQNGNLIDIVQLLIGTGAEVNTKNKNGWTPLHILCRYYQNDNLINIVQLLIGKGAEVNVQAEDGVTPLHFLCRHYQNDNLIDIVQLLIENGAEVNVQLENGVTPLNSLCFNYKNDNLLDIVRLFIEKGAEVNVQTAHGVTPLQSLCLKYKNDNLIDIVRLLVEGGAEVNVQIALHILCRFYEIDNEMKKEKLESLVRLFEQYGASMDAVNNLQETPNYLSMREVGGQQYISSAPLLGQDPSSGSSFSRFNVNQQVSSSTPTEGPRQLRQPSSPGLEIRSPWGYPPGIHYDADVAGPMINHPISPPVI